MVFLSGGIALTAQQVQGYNKILATIDTEKEYDQSQNYHAANSAYRATKGWFWQCDDLCTRNYNRMSIEKAKLDEIRTEGYAILSEAKSQAGIFSTTGVEEVKSSFWAYFNKGATFAKRQTMYDAIFSGFRSMSRNESTSEYLMKMVMQAMFNFSIGLLICLVTFTLGLYSIIKSYQPDTITGLVFFFCAFAGAFATVTTVIGAMFGTVGGGAFMVAKAVEAQQRLEGGPGQQRRHLHQQ